MDADEILSHFGAFGDMSPRRRRALSEDVTTARLTAGSYTFVSGASCEAVAFVGSGRIRVFKQGDSGREIALYHVGPGETCLLTLSCALTGDRYPAGGVIDEAVEAALLPVDRFRVWFETDPTFRTYVVRTITGRLVELMQLVEDVAFRDVGSRLARYLLDAGGAHGGSILSTHDHIALELGTSRETVSRLLKEYERRSIVELTRGTVRIVDLRGLGELVE